jgi:hypothetical protein
MRYQIAWEDYFDKFQTEVNSLISQGFKPIGSLVIYPNPASSSGFRYYQPMIKE